MAEGEEVPEQKKSKALLWILLILVLGGAGAGGYFALSGNAKASAPAVPVQLPAQYYRLDPAFVVNFEAEQLVRFLQVTVELMTRDPVTVEVLKRHDPVIRNDLLMLLSNQQYSVIATNEGKESLRKQALETVRKIVAREGGRGESIEAVYFTSFVMQ